MPDWDDASEFSPPLLINSLFPGWDEKSDFVNPLQVRSIEALLVISPLALLAFIQHLGADGESLLKDFSNLAFEVLLCIAETENISSLMHNYPNIFYYRDGQQDFFPCALRVLSIEHSREIVFPPQGIEKLQQKDRSGIPYLFHLLSEDKFELLEEITEKYPDLLNVTTLDGLGFKDLLKVEEIPSKIKKWLERKFGD